MTKRNLDSMELWHLGSAKADLTVRASSTLQQLQFLYKSHNCDEIMSTEKCLLSLLRPRSGYELYPIYSKYTFMIYTLIVI